MPNDSTITIIQDSNADDSSQDKLILPAGFDTLPPEEQEAIKNIIANKLVYPSNGIYVPPKKDEGHYIAGPTITVFTIAIVILLISRWIRTKPKLYDTITRTSDDNNYYNDTDTAPAQPDYLVYDGNNLGFPTETYRTILQKHHPYFTLLNEDGQNRFLDRLKKFIKSKTFVIHDNSGFKEMPVLISAAAIQVSFGLKEFMLPYFQNIYVFPEEFLGTSPNIRVLEGNVSGNNIHLSWKHFLDGFRLPDDGQNVGLHEMAHAYYFQNIEVKDEADDHFVKNLDGFNSFGNKVFEMEKRPGYDLYSDYALTDFQEFWAETVEIFFEKPLALMGQYPDLYKAMSELLNQDPIHFYSAQNPGSFNLS